MQTKLSLALLLSACSKIRGPRGRSLEGNVFTYHSKDIGIVVIGRNEGERLISALAAAKSQCEHLVYADSASTDASVERAQGLGVTTVSLDDSLQLTAARGRKAGFERLLEVFPRCRYVQFIDGDCIIDPTWLATASSFLDANPHAAVVCGRRFEAFPNASLYNRLIDDEWNTPIGQSTSCGGDSMMRVNALLSAGSFRSDLRAGEEPELCARLRAKGWEIWRIDALMTEHDAGIDRFSQWWRRAERGGFGYAQVWSATKDAPPRLYGRQIASALLWAVIVPLFIIAVAIATGSRWAFMLVPAIYGVQILRIAARRNRMSGFGKRLKSAAVTMLVKIAETMGVLRYWFGFNGNVKSYRELPAGHQNGLA